MDLSSFVSLPYRPDRFLEFLKDFLPDDFRPEKKKIIPEEGSVFNEINQLGRSEKLDLVVFECHHSKKDPRVKLTRDAFKFIINYEVCSSALVAFVNEDKSEYRFSLITFDVEKNPVTGRSKYILLNPRRFSFILGGEVGHKTPESRLKGRVETVDKLKERFSVEALSRDFYRELFNWYQWALSADVGITFPNNPETTLDDREDIKVKIIRLITRVLFVWFIKQKKLVPDSLFSTKDLREILKNFDQDSETDGCFYNAILQNLFFATLNCAVTDENGNKQRSFERKDSGTNYRYAEMFKKGKSEVVELFHEVPFLNGGLFECLDKEGMLYDGFHEDDSRAENGNYKYRAFVPNKLFFSEDNDQPGLITLFNKYNFTVEENSTNDAVVSLDPELLGLVFENLLAAKDDIDLSKLRSSKNINRRSARKDSGSYYTPRAIVDFMVDNAIIEYIKTKQLGGVEDGDLEWLFKNNEIPKNQDTKAPKWDSNKIKEITCALKSVKILDPACGSGAFPMGCLLRIAEIIEILNDHTIDRYDLKYEIIENCIHGVDIQSVAMLICKLRFFISLICDQEDMDRTKPESNFGVNPLPNLETKFVAADSLIKIQKKKSDVNQYLSDQEIENAKKKLGEIRHNHFVADSTEDKVHWRREDEAARKKLKEILLRKKEFLGFDSKEDAEQLASWNPYDQNSVSPFFEPEWMFGISEGFDIVIGNPPYVSPKGVPDKSKAAYKRQFGFTDDTYNLFTVKGLLLCKKDGLLSFITPKTFWTIQTKRNVRDLLLSNTLIYILDMLNPFKGAKVDPCVFLVKNTTCEKGHKIKFLDAKESLSSPKPLEPESTSTYTNALNSVIFMPTEPNMKLYRSYNIKIKSLYEDWWGKINNSKKISKNRAELEKYRASLEPGKITLIGCLVDGGQGLATADNGRFIALRNWSREAEIAKKKLSIKLAKAIEDNRINIQKSIPELMEFSSIEECLSSLPENKIVDIFDRLKRDYGRDIFGGKGLLFRIIDDSQLADPDSLTDDEKENGIDPTKKNYYVIYDKGDSEGNKWFLETPFAIAWSKANVGFLKGNSGKKEVGMPVVRNSQFYFKEGICWNVTSGKELLCRKKKKGVYDVNSMFAFSATEWLPDEFFLCVLNSKLVGNYLRAFINNTVAVQINDVRQVPIVIPTDEQVAKAKELAERGIYLKKNKGSDEALESLQSEVDDFVAKLYGISGI